MNFGFNPRDPNFDYIRHFMSSKFLAQGHNDITDDAQAQDDLLQQLNEGVAPGALGITGGSPAGNPL